MNTTEITWAFTPTAAAAYKGLDAILTLNDGTTLTGTFLSVNSKGWNITIDGKTVSRGLKTVAKVQVIGNDVPSFLDGDNMTDEDEIHEIERLTEEGEFDEDEDFTANADQELADLVNELDGATTAELAEVFGIAAKELRVHLRALGMGVGKGHRYHLNADQIQVVKTALTA